LENIEKEWQSFIALTNDTNLVERYEKELDELNNDYQIISDQFKADSDNISIVENLVNNLQRRLQLLKDIQEHIKLLNEENGHYETIQI
jgi:septation ring formation regulator EzrA